MRRSSSDQKHLNLFITSIFSFVMLVMGSLYTFLPSFAGVFFVYILLNYENEKSKLFVYLSFLYLFCYELNRGFYLFSYLFTFFIFYNIFLEKVRNFFSCHNCILFVYVVTAYLGHYSVNLFISYLLNQDMTPLSWGYGYYILIDTLVAAVIFKGKV